MQQTELNELLKYLDEINAATVAGKMIWSATNPTTYIWTPSQNPNNRFLLQKINPNPPLFVFQAVETGKIKLNVMGQEMAAINQRLLAIFLSIERIKDQSGLEFLKSQIPSP